MELKHMGKLNCFLDGNALCIVKLDFEDLMVSNSMFITLTDEQIKEFESLEREVNEY